MAVWCTLGELGKNLQRLSFWPSIYSPAYKRVTPALVQACYQQRRQVVPWTVNTPAEAAQLLETGVAGLITDYPDLLTGK